MSCDRLIGSSSRWSLFPFRLQACATEAGTGVLEQAQTLLGKGDYEKAAAIIEDALPTTAPGDRTALIDLLRQSYRKIISQAESAGKTRIAQEYRDNLAIIELPLSRRKDIPGGLLRLLRLLYPLRPEQRLIRRTVHLFPHWRSRPYPLPRRSILPRFLPIGP